MKIFFYTILLVFILLDKTNCQEGSTVNRAIDTYRQDIKEIFDQKIRIKFKNNILGTGSECENDSYFFPPDKLVDEKYEVLCYYSGHHGLAAIFICDNKIFYRTNKVPFPHYRITKESEIENHNNEAYSEFSNAIEYASEDEEKKDFIENGFKALKNAREAKNRKNDYITKEIKISTDLKIKILSAFQKMKNLTPSTNEWKPYQNIFSFLSMKPVLKYGCESYDFIDNGKLIYEVRTNNIVNAPNAVDAKSTAERDLRCDIERLLLTKGPVYQLGYNDAFFGFNLPSCY